MTDDIIGEIINACNPIPEYAPMTENMPAIV